MKDRPEAARERELVQLYQELTGASESTARAVYMYVSSRENEGADCNGLEQFGTVLWPGEATEATAWSTERGESWKPRSLPVPAPA